MIIAETEKLVEYREVPGFPNYKVGDDGSVWSRYKHAGYRYGVTVGDSWKLLKRSQDRDGYCRVGLYANKKVKHFRVHRLVLEAFVGPCPEGMEGCHSPDPCRSNNNLSNLRWGTDKSNGQDMVKDGRSQAGVKNNKAKLNEQQVLAIRNAFASGSTARSLANKYSLNITVVWDLLKFRTWKNVGGPVAPIRLKRKEYAK